MQDRIIRPDPSSPGAAGPRSALTLLMVYAAFLALGVVVYRAALGAPFVSDDVKLIPANPFLALPLGELLPAAFDPSGEARQHVGGNYAPLVHGVHAVEMRLFGTDTRGYHVVNLLLHALNASLLLVLLQRSGLAYRVALGASAIFLLHPANVEAVAWISQLRTLLATALAFAALLLRRRPLASTLLFALGLLSKTSATFVIPLAAVFLFVDRRRGESISSAATGLALWLLAVALYLPLQAPAFSSIAQAFGDPYPDPWIHLRSIVAIGARYVAMAVSGYGVSAFHEPEPVHSNLDPWWLAGLALAAAVGWRVALTLRRARPESGWWLSAAAGFLPISQAVPFMFGMGDRYLYCMLPGLLGGVCLAGTELRDALARRLRGRSGVWLSRAALTGSVLLAGMFALHASERATLWQDETRLLADSASQYPNGAVGRYVRAVAALQAGDTDAALAHLRASAARGGGLLHPFHGDPMLAPLRDDPRFVALLRDIAQMSIDVTAERGLSGQRQLYKVAGAHYLRGELDLAIERLEQALRAGGPQDAEILAALERIRLERAEGRTTGPLDPPPRR